MPNPIRYAVAGLGYIAQAAVLPAFANARDNSVLAALISNDPEKRRELSKKYGVDRACSYDEYERCLAEGIDAVYIALPNHMHREYTVRAARAGVHVLCEKPMAITEDECEEMIRACADHSVKLMIAYRLHFEAANLGAIEVVQSGRIGEPRYFSSVFSQQVGEGNIRVRAETGGGTLYDIGIYCINAARYLFRDEPAEVWCATARKDEPRFREVEETASAIMRFHGERLAVFTCSFGAANANAYRIVGTQGDLLVEPAFLFDGDLRHRLAAGGKSEERVFGARDQFGPLLSYFSGCIQDGRTPEPSGEEGLADVRIIRALYRSAAEGKAMRLSPFARSARPSPAQELKRPRIEEQPLLNAQDPSRAA